jgi:hypothetical protein
MNASLPDYARLGHWQNVSAFTAETGTLTGNGKLRREAISELYFPATTEILKIALFH